MICNWPVLLLFFTLKIQILIPNYDWLKCVYCRNSDCIWRIERLGDSNSMELSFKFIDIEWEKDGPCSYDNVKIRDGKLMSIEGGAVMVFSATFNNISVISFRSVLLVEETVVRDKQ